MSVVLAIEPDSPQAEALRKAVRGRVDLELVLVSNTAAAIRALEHSVPDLILVSALLSPRDEDALFAHLRSLDGSSHLQTLTIPQLRLGKAPAAKRGSLGRFRKKPAAPQPAGCDPALFVAEVVAHLARASELQSQAAEMAPTRTIDRRPVVEPSRSIERPVEVAPRIEIEQPILQAERGEGPPRLEADREAAWGAGASQAERSERDEGPPRLIDDPWVDLDVDALTQQIGLNSVRLELQDPPAEARREEELARVEAEAQVRLTAEIERVQHEAEERHQHELARLQAQAEAERQTAVEHARVEAEAQVRLTAEMERVQHKAEERHQHELARIQAEAEAERQTAVEHARVEAEYEARRTLAAEQDQAAEARREEELARVEAEAQARLTAEIERVQREAEERHRLELARVQAEAEAERQTAVEQARAEAEYEARHALAAELEQVRVGEIARHAHAIELEQIRLNEIARVQAEADQRCDTAARQAREAAEAEAARTMMQELGRVRAEVEQALNDQLERARAEADALRKAELARAHAEATVLRAAAAEDARLGAEAAASRALEGEVARVRADAEVRLRAELDVIRAENEHLRRADQSEARQTSEKVREAAIRDARAIAEAANHTLEDQLVKVRAEAAARLEAELSKARTDAEQQRTTELEEIRVQVAQMRESAALQARRAAAEAIASEVARAGVEPEPIAIHEEPAVVDSRPAAVVASSYYNLWNPPAETIAAPPPPLPEQEPPQSSVGFTRSKWALPLAAALLLVVGNGIVIGWSWRPHFPKAAPAPIVVPVEQPAAHIADEVTVKTGRIDVSTDPPGAQVLLDGARAGKTPLTLSKLKPGRHTLVLQSSTGTITRTVTVKAGETAQVSEGIFSGWLAVYAGIPVNIYVGGQLRGTTEDGQLMLSAGAHAVELVNERLNYRETKNFTIEPGQVVTYSIALPTSVIRVNSPEGTEVSIDGAAAGRTPLGDLPVSIGTHEVVGTSPEMGQRRESIEVKLGEPAVVTFK